MAVGPTALCRRPPRGRPVTTVTAAGGAVWTADRDGVWGAPLGVFPETPVHTLFFRLPRVTQSLQRLRPCW